MRLSDLCIPGKPGTWELEIEGERITGLAATGSQFEARSSKLSSPGSQLSLPGSQLEARSPQLSLPGALLIPGLINSHDHLDFNLFPALGNAIYSNYRTWGWDIHSRNKQVIDAVLKVPLELRTQWGVYKNLLNGFTTVVNHGVKLRIDQPMINVFQGYPCLHSVGFEKNWRWKLNKHFRSPQPFVLHVGEGTDPDAHEEISRLIRWNLFKRPLIGIHGVAMDEGQASSFRALVWCPASNQFLLRQTAPVERLKRTTTLLFGTDSTLTAPWNAWCQIKMARNEGGLTDSELLDALTSSAARVWDLPDTGELACGKMADIVIAGPGPGLQPTEDLFSIGPGDLLLVMHKGNLRLFDESLSSNFATGSFQRIQLEGRTKYVEGDLAALMREIRYYYPDVMFPPEIGT